MSKEDVLDSILLSVFAMVSPNRWTTKWEK